MRRRAAIPIALLLGGCTRLIDLDFGRCGNGLVEPELGEKCDNAVDSSLGDRLVCGPPGVPSQACQYVCGATNAVCPAGWVCGEDDVCMHAVSEFTATFSASLGSDVFSFQSGDFDGDGTRDLLLGNNGGARVDYNSGGTFGRSFDLPLPIASEPALADLDRDGLTDVTIGFNNALLVFLGQPDGRPLPAGIANDLDEILGLEVGAGARGFGIAVLDAVRSLFVIRTEEGVCFSPRCIGPMEPLPDGAGDDPEVLPLTVTATDARVAVVFAGTSEVLVVDLLESGTVVERVPVPRPLLGRMALFDGALLLQIESDDPRHADAVARMDIDSLAVAIDESFEPLTCFFAECTPEPQRIFPLAAGDFDGDGRSGVITPLGVFEQADSGWWTTWLRFDESDLNGSAFVHDLNRDGFMDAVIVAERAERLDVLLGDGNNFFTATPIAIRAKPDHIAIGDFDGDLDDDDLAFVEPEVQSDSIAVLYYDTPLFTAKRFPVAGRVQSLSAGTPPHRAAQLIAVVAAEGETKRGALVLDGTTYQLMISVLAPVAATGAMLGYVGTPTFDDTGPTLLAAWDLEEGVWQWSRDDGERFVRRPVRLGGTECPSQEIQPCLTLIDAPLERGSDHESLIMAVSNQCPANPQPRIILGRRAAVGRDLECTAIPIEPFESGFFGRMRTADLDGEGPLELVMLAPHELRIYWNFSEDGGVTALPFEADDFVLLNADDDPALELIAVSFGRARIFDLDGRALSELVEFDLSAPLDPQFFARAIADDFTGDGLDDLVVAHGQRYTLYVSKSSRDRP